MGQASEVGFYSMRQLASFEETDKQKGQIGIFPWSRSTIRRMIKRGKFPLPIKGLGQAMVWPKDVIHAYIEKIKEEGGFDD